MSVIWCGLLVLAVLTVAWALVLCAGRVARLDRLHVRVDAARAALHAALERRAGAALAVAEVLAHDGLKAAVAARSEPSALSWPAEWEAAENALGRQLRGIDRALLPAECRAELADAEQLVVLARCVHNDAVRDTLVLRSRRLVRWLHLAGTAPMPAYFEIADPNGLAELTYDAGTIGPLAD